jgi:DNA-binding CsgD family transcriptional regulator
MGGVFPSNPNGHIFAFTGEVEAKMPTTTGPDAESLPAEPKGLAAWRFDIGGEEFALLESGDPQPEILPGLTGAEADVARLAAQGLSNKQIAVRRGTSPRTVANQIASLFRKLGLASRPELLARLRRVVTGR